MRSIIIVKLMVTIKCYYSSILIYIFDIQIIYMKKLYTLLLFILIGLKIQAQIINIPDFNFKNKLLSASSSNCIATNGDGLCIKIDTNDNGQIEVSEVSNVATLYIDNSYISDLTGINSFSNLDALYCYSNFITSLNITSLFNLTILDCSYNELSTLNASGLVNLNFINCSQNNITNLNITGDINLSYLYCGANQLTSLNLTGFNSLITLSFGYNSLSTINLTGLTNLTGLFCNNNLLTALDLSPTPNLASLGFANNQISEIDLSDTPNLISISAQNNFLTTLNLLNLNVGSLDVSNNQLTSLDVSNCLQLSNYLRCSNNQLTTLDVSMCPNLYDLNCSNNQLNSLFIKNGRNENQLDFSGNPNLNYVCADEGQITTVQNKASLYGYINCEVNNYCSFTPGGIYYYVNGNSRFDSNGDGCDINDISYPFNKLSIDNGTTTITSISNSLGVHENYVVAGSYTITPIIENPTYFAVSPATFTVNFPTPASPFTQNFCITPNGIKHDVEVTILPINVARPGFDAIIKLFIKTKEIKQKMEHLIYFDDAILDLISAIPAYTTQIQ